MFADGPPPLQGANRRTGVTLKTLAAFALLLALSGPALAQPKLGGQAPAYVGPLLDGKPLDLNTLKGHVAVVNFWATWCTPCRAEMPMLDAYYQAHKAQGLKLVGLSADKTRDLAKVRMVASTVSYPIALTADARTNGYGQVYALPLTYVLDAQGRVRTIFNGGDGQLTEKQLDSAVIAASR
jgi:thiol-disulfide isomerase/thioredoxin